MPYTPIEFTPDKSLSNKIKRLQRIIFILIAGLIFCILLILFHLGNETSNSTKIKQLQKQNYELKQENRLFKKQNNELKQENQLQKNQLKRYRND